MAVLICDQRLCTFLILSLENFEYYQPNETGRLLYKIAKYNRWLSRKVDRALLVFFFFFAALIINCAFCTGTLILLEESRNLSCHVVGACSAPLC